jgi:hypothetical protein
MSVEAADATEPAPVSFVADRIRASRRQIPASMPGIVHVDRTSLSDDRERTNKCVRDQRWSAAELLGFGDVSLDLHLHIRAAHALRRTSVDRRG